MDLKGSKFSAKYKKLMQEEIKKNKMIQSLEKQSSKELDELYDRSQNKLNLKD